MRKYKLFSPRKTRPAHVSLIHVITTCQASSAIVSAIAPCGASAHGQSEPTVGRKQRAYWRPLNTKHVNSATLRDM